MREYPLYLELTKFHRFDTLTSDIFMDKSESTGAITFIVTLIVNTEKGIEQNKREAFRKWGGDGEGGEKLISGIQISDDRKMS